MFTGIIEEIGSIAGIISRQDIKQIEINAKLVLEGLKIGDSVAVSGICLTVVKINPASFVVEVSSETLSCSTFFSAKVGDKVNLERAVSANARLGGHIVQGHVDGVGEIKNAEHRAQNTELRINIPEQLRKYVVEKGSIAVDGVSLTVAKIEGNNIIISVIPHTLENTTLKDKKTGSKVNIEVDVMGKYAENFQKGQKGGLSREVLGKAGFIK
jgi:riboflavin synthase